MYIGNHTIKVIGKKYNNGKKMKTKNVTLVDLKSEEGIHIKKLLPILEGIEEGYECGCKISVNVIMEQHDYR
jgi:hypothetical protein